MFEVLRGGHKPLSVFSEAIASHPRWECSVVGFSRHCVCTVPYLAAQNDLARRAFLIVVKLFVCFHDLGLGGRGGVGSFRRT
jgi:hypothetical protein